MEGRVIPLLSPGLLSRRPHSLEQVQLGARNATWAFRRSDEGPPGPAPLSSEQQEAALEGQQLGPGEDLDTGAWAW